MTGKRKELASMASKHFSVYAPNMAIDMGTANIIVATSDKGIIKNDPSVLALDIVSKKVLAKGKAAKDLIGKSPENLVAVKPFSNGAVSDFELSKALIEYYIHETGPNFCLFGPTVVMAMSSFGGDIEQRALQDAVYQAGAREVILVDQALAAAYGAGFIDKKSGSGGTLVVDCGAGISSVSIVSTYGLITSQCLHKGGDYLDKEISKLLRNKFDIIIGENSAESLKIEIGSLAADKQKNAMQIGGRDALSGMPRSIDVYGSDLYPVFEKFGQELALCIKKTLEKTPPELAAEIVGRGLCLTGGLALLDGLAQYLENKLEIRVIMSENPVEDVAKGCLVLLRSKKSDVRGRV